MAISRVDFGGQTLIDLTNDSVTPETLMAGETAHNAAGEAIVGTASGGQPVIINNLITGQQTNLTKITISTSDPDDDYVFQQGEICLTYGEPE